MDLQDQITADHIKDHHVVVMQQIDLPTLLPLLQEKGILSSSDLERVSDSTHHGSIERTGFLLHSLYKEGQRAIDTFIECLRSSGKIPGHRKILQLLEEGEPELPGRSPLFDILDENLDVIERQINLTSFLNALTHAGTLKISNFLDLQNPDRSVRQNLERLISVLDQQGSRGFINFLSCLHNDPEPAHETLFNILFQRVKAFFKHDPRSENVGNSDKIELLQLETRDASVGIEYQRRLKQHKDRLIAEINFTELLPHLKQQNILQREDIEYLDSVKPELQNAHLINLLEKVDASAIEKFVQCLKDSAVHQGLHELFIARSEPPQFPASSVDAQKRTSHKHDKVAVFVCMKKYFVMNEHYRAEEKNYGHYVKEPMQKLKQFLETLSFYVIDFPLNIEGSPLEQLKESKVKHSATDAVTESFQKIVVNKCNEGAIVFIYISGIQFPFKEDRDISSRFGDFSGAILRGGVSKTSRKLAECIVARQLLHWVELLPKAFVTFLVDTHQSHVHEFGKQRQPKTVEILEDPWKMLTPLHSNTVVYFLRPDPIAMSRLQVEEKEIGRLSAKFVEVLFSSYMRKPEGLSHRTLYEAISFLWHKQGREHKLFVPAVQGDVDREFLGKEGLPYQQFFRADLKKQQGKKFNLDELQIATGTMAGLILGDQLEIFHILRPSVVVSGIVTRAHSLDCVAKVLDERHGKAKLSEVLTELYQSKDKDFKSEDGSTEFLHVKKKFALHERIPVCLEGLKSSESETIKSYIKSKSALLSFVTSKLEAKIIIRHDRQYFILEDLNEDIKYKAKARTVQHVKSFLEMIAWYKYVNKLKPDNEPSSMHQLCFLTAEKCLLSKAAPQCTEFNIKWSSFETSQSEKGEPNPHDAILQFSEVLKFWSPQPTDASPCLEVEFKRNHVITAVEIRGDPTQEGSHIKDADVYYQKNIMQKAITGPSIDEATVHVDVKRQEAVRFVTIEPKEFGETFTITVKMKKKLMSGGKSSVVSVNSVQLVHWHFHKQRQTPWKCIPAPDNLGNIDLDQTMCWMSWSGRSFDPITFDLGPHGVQLVKLEFTAPSDGVSLKKFALRLQSDWFRRELDSILSVWPTKIDFKQPIVASNFQLLPKLSEQRPQNNFKVQMQVYGNKHGLPIEVEEGDILTFYFENFTSKPMFVYIFCLEETGSVKFVTMDVAQGRVFPLKKLLQTYIPEGYNPAMGQITDLYRVFVSTRKMYLEPFIQRGLNQYHETCCYNVCSLGHRSDVGNESWFEYQFSVIVNKSPKR